MSRPVNDDITLDRFARNTLRLLDNDAWRAEEFMVGRLAAGNDDLDLLRAIVRAAITEARKPTH